MKNFFLITNEYKDPGLALTKKICSYINEKGGNGVWYQSTSEDDSREALDISEIPKNTECIIVIGGDGTVIRSAGETVDLGIPLIGVNLGNMGYLCELEEDSVFHAIDQIFEDRYMIEDRMMLKGYLIRDGKKTDGNVALNDIVIHCAGSLHVVNLNVYVNGQFLSSYEADGIIAATPTGSTAYSMSAGGPIVDPKANMIVLTPINSHMLNTRSIVLDAKDRIEIETASRGKGNPDKVVVSFDGSHPVILEKGERIVIEKAKKKTGILKLSKISFLEILRKKMQSYR